MVFNDNNKTHSITAKIDWRVGSKEPDPCASQCWSSQLARFAVVDGRFPIANPLPTGRHHLPHHKSISNAYKKTKFRTPPPPPINLFIKQTVISLQDQESERDTKEHDENECHTFAKDATAVEHFCFILIVGCEIFVFCWFLRLSAHLRNANQSLKVIYSRCYKPQDEPVAPAPIQRKSRKKCK